MNIFYLSRDPETCARWHVDKHVHQMIREYSQLLCYAHRLRTGTPTDVPAGARGYGWGRVEWTLVNPVHEYEFYHLGRMGANICTQWASASPENYLWLLALLDALHNEYRYRYGNAHEVYCRLRRHLTVSPPDMPEQGWTQPPCAMHPRFVEIGNSLESYRECYRYGKNPIAVWTARDPPAWYMVPGMHVVALPPGKTGQPRVRVVNPAIQFEITPRGKTRGIKPPPTLEILHAR